jgi:hypothetical protein
LLVLEVGYDLGGGGGGETGRTGTAAQGITMTAMHIQIHLDRHP